MLAETVGQQVKGDVEPPPPRLLILRCASTKRPGSAPMPAIERYDGPAFRVLRKYLRSEPIDPPLVRVVSAEHGLMTLEQRIEEYDRRMDAERAQELQPLVLGALAQLVREQPVREVLVVVGQTYLLALTGLEEVLDRVPVRIAGETQGRKLGVLRAWLYGETPSDGSRQATLQSGRAPRQLPLVSSTGRSFQVGGQRFTVSADQVMTVARQALVAGEKAAIRIRHWYVPINGERVSPKWLVSQVSGVPLRTFQTHAALGILDRLGIPVRKVDEGDSQA